MKSLVPILLLAAVTAVQAQDNSQPASVAQRVISEAGARRVLIAAETQAQQLHAPSAIAVVDASGILVAFVRMDDVRPGSPELAIGKARTSALLRRPSGETEDNVDNGRTAFVTSGFMTLRGGFPILDHGEVIGAIGVAGVNKDNDVRISQAAASVLDSK
ncbi:GlcG/HbpS family heme-binding protein [Silvibacterium dinghuense]|uniref:Heme-binding protein n=1 Tax=Silvibacterium dinghuense TaxID=1560006 RepID=A0A4Q1SBT4_9BACT|nr:heme-binding protein [Silvibacterium dinghuense]RXS94586.1 heme-binding protein [Silvibacterium dinghuense]GGH15186.1 hypothetical protein GCM10011586_36100 [Silvibacterium dinghuense]